MPKAPPKPPPKRPAPLPLRSFEQDGASFKLEVPGAVRAARSGVGRMMTWIHGPPKIGKTTFANSLGGGGTWFVATEVGQDFIDCREPTYITSWPEFLDFCAYVQEHKPIKFGDGQPITNLAIDTIDNLYKMCEEFIAKELGVEVVGEVDDRGKSWARLSGEFERVMNKVRRWPFPLTCISHSRQKEFKTKARKVDRMEPAIGAGGFRWLEKSADLILYAHSNQTQLVNDKGEAIGATEQRVIQCHPESWVIAGGRMSDRLPKILPLDAEELEAYLTGRKEVDQ